ncbi:zinc finger, CCHC-type containing protein [Tanacetum coccineum]|uniref:Zinc finger, CCHC-type containing protein n=1 Tax=Tanacetum coccineum TaxID=301880 RepID=A0ABQ5A0M0_9ASTR
MLRHMRQLMEELVSSDTCKIDDKLNYLEHPIPAALVIAHAGHQVPPEAHAAYTAWLKTLFSQQAEQELLQTVREFHTCKQEEGQSEYDSFVQNYNMHDMGKTLNELHDMLKLHEQTLPQKDAPALHAIKAGKVQKKINKNKKHQLAARIPPPPKKENPAKDSVCHQCGDTGHWKQNCPQYLSELLKNKKPSQGASTSVLRGSRKLKPGALSLYIRNGQRATIEANRSYHLFSRNNLVYFRVVLRDGIYGTDLSNSNTNDSSMYVVSNKRVKLNLESALLRSCRYPKETMGYSFYYPPENKVFIARNAEFLENSLITQEARYLKETMGYSFYYPPENKVFIARNAEFLENSLITQEARYPKETMGYSFYYPLENKLSSWIRRMQTEGIRRIGNSSNAFSCEVLARIRRISFVGYDILHPSGNISLHHDEGDQETDKPQSDIIPIRRSTRTRHALDRMCLYIDDEEYELEDLNEPANYKAALLDPKFDKWLDYMNV